MPTISTFRLDSSLADRSRWPFPPSASDIILRCEADTLVTTLRNGEQVLTTWADPLAALRWLDVYGRSHGSILLRWIGFISYDLGRLFESLPVCASNDLQTPLFAFACCADASVVFPDAGLREEMDTSKPGQAQGIARGLFGRLQSTFTADDYRRAVSKVIDYIHAGDIFQANLAQRFTVETLTPAARIYDKLLKAAPATYGGLLDFGDFALVCNSPELFFRATTDSDGRRRIVTRPIKGTRPRLPGMDLELRDSVKDEAELNMIIDLERNDLGRICEIGTVKVIEPRTIEAHPTVYHGVSTIEGILQPKIGLVEILRAMFPGGSITGAPKIRAMEIIEELEPVRRGPYCGAIGYLAPDGATEFNVAIRTMVAKDGRIHISVGGGIVADSDPHAEYEETLVKAQAMFAALGVSIEQLR